jgi:hypothetical protein
LNSIEGRAGCSTDRGIDRSHHLSAYSIRHKPLPSTFALRLKSLDAL